MAPKIKNLITRALPPETVAFLKKTRSALKKMRQSQTQPKITKERIINDLDRLGVKHGDVVFAHSSLRSVGFVEGGAETVIDALMDAVGREGTLAMPCFSIVGSMQDSLDKGAVFDVAKTPSTVGAISEAFRSRGGVARSLHPTHSVCACGPKAEFIADGHEKAGTIFGPETPLYKIMEINGWILGLGVDFGPVTFVHVIEDTLKNFPLKIYSDKIYNAKIIGYDKKIKHIKLRAHDQETAKSRIDKNSGIWIRNFLKNHLKEKGMLKTGRVGMAECWMVKSADLFNEQKKLLEKGITVYMTEREYEEKQKKND